MSNVAEHLPTNWLDDWRYDVCEQRVEQRTWKKIFLDLTEWCRRREELLQRLGNTNEWSSENSLDQPRERRSGRILFHWTNWPCPKSVVWFVCHRWWSFVLRIPHLNLPDRCSSLLVLAALTNRQIVNRLEPLVGELQQQTWFAHT